MPRALRLLERPAWPRRCPVCRARLTRFRRRPGSRDRALCPRCGSRQRHRLLWLWLERETPLLRDGLDVLHLAPEPGIEARLRRCGNLRYRTGDLAPGADLRLDLQDLALPSESLDVVLCSHVLEHVPDDRAALREIHRVLRPGGWAVLQVPIQGEVTVEDPALQDPTARRARFGQDDHVRQYGRDYARRLADAGFEVLLTDYRPALTRADVRRHGLGYRLQREYGIDFDALREPWEIWHVRRPAPPGQAPGEGQAAARSSSLAGTRGPENSIEPSSSLPRRRTSRSRA